MKIEAFELKDGIKISKKALNEALVKYRTMFNVACHTLYDMCYISTPAEFDKIEMGRAMMGEFPEYMKHFRSEVDAVMEWTAKRCKYVRLMAEREQFSEEFIEVVKILEELLTAEEAVNALSNISARCRFSKGATVDFVYPRINFSKRVWDSSVYQCDVPAVQEVFVRSQNSDLVVVNTADIYRTAILKELGVSDDQILATKEANRAFFISWMTLDEELEFFDMIITGDVVLDGEFAELLQQRIDEDAQYTVASTKTQGMTVVDTLGELIFTQSLEERNEYVKKIRKELEAEYDCVRAFYVSNTATTFEVSNKGASVSESSESSSTTEQTDKAFTIPEYFIGGYAFDYGNEVFLPEINLLDGVSGELISQADVNNNGYVTTASPVKIKRVRKSGDNVKVVTEPYYMIADVRLSDEKDFSGQYVSRPLSAKSGVLFEVPNATEAQIWGTVHVTSKQDFYKTIRGRVSSVFRNMGENANLYLDFVAEMVCAMKYFSYGCQRYDLMFDTYSYIDESLYLKACYDAMEIYANV